MAKHPLVWFRSDLRVADNTALHEAAAAAHRAGGDVVAVFTICPGQWVEAHDWAPIKVDFTLRALASLSASLATLNIPLRVLTVDRFAGVPGSLLTLARALGRDSLWFNEEYEVNELARDEAARVGFTRAELSVHAFTDQVVYRPGEVLTQTGEFYTVYSPFKRRWKEVWKSGGQKMVLPVPRRFAAMPCTPDPVPDVLPDVAATSVGGVNTAPRERARWADLWPASEAAAHARLERFVERSLEPYKTARDFPGTDSTGKVSHFLATGVLSPRQCIAAALEANSDKIDSGSPGAVHWIDEVLWREFYKHITVGFPRVCRHQPFRLETRAIRWADNDAHFLAWCSARTGYPIVDAAMRQLTTTGWMHNRCRMIVASFLTKNLFIDWRRGERFFMQHLIDGDLASNNGGWQWSASTGTDAAPYFRIFSPVSQAERFDPDGAYIRQFIPELEGMDTAALHDPDKLTRLRLFASTDYPPPLVDHKATRAEAIDRFRVLGEAGAS